MSATVRFLPRGSSTFDVYVGTRCAGSVWSFGDLGWVAFDNTPFGYQVRAGFFATRGEAAAELAS